AVYIEATDGPNGADLFFRFSDQNISVGSSQELFHIFNGVIGFPTLPATPLQVHITEYGSVGQYISGNFTGTVHDFNPPHTAYLLTCNFRVKRQF
ncbi:MAG TPA: hypothetical protein VK489_00130, partial [Ferruginibacter sp.]|nr:hypothetical protein [Ferruginibacter sp.]